MKITVLGAAGNAGSRVVAEALSRGHEVTAVERNSPYSNGQPTAARVLIGDAVNVEDVAKISASQDVVISAIASFWWGPASLTSGIRLLEGGESVSYRAACSPNRFSWFVT